MHITMALWCGSQQLYGKAPVQWTSRGSLLIDRYEMYFMLDSMKESDSVLSDFIQKSRRKDRMIPVLKLSQQALDSITEAF